MTGKKTPNSIDHKIYPEVRYFGALTDNGVGDQAVYKMEMPDGKPEKLRIEPSQKLLFYSPEFNWGYSGSGPDQLALAILYDATLDPQDAQLYDYEFKIQFVVDWKSYWSISRTEVREWLANTKQAELIARQNKN